jgi:hypothetical protein
MTKFLDTGKGKRPSSIESAAGLRERAAGSEKRLFPVREPLPSFADAKITTLLSIAAVKRTDNFGRKASS